MKALTLTQPWATLVALGVKTIETRSWPTNYRGALAIHAAKGMDGLARSMAQSTRFLPRPTRLPLGAIVAKCQLVDVVPTCGRETCGGISEADEALGNYAPGRFAWVLSGVVALEEPVPARGALGLWEWEP